MPIGQPPLVLIVSYSRDNEAIPRVIDAVAARGGQAIRFDTDCFPTETRLAAGYHNGETQWRLRGGDYELDLNRVSAVWYRRIAAAHRLPDEMDEGLKRAAMDESKATIDGVIAGLDAFHLDPLQRVQRADHKPLQLKMAQSLGLQIPHSLISNDPQAVRDFAGSCGEGMIMKTLTAFAVREQGEEKVVFTNSVDAADLAHLEELRYCSALFQERVPKQLELRATVVGEKVFTAAIDSQRDERTRIDWRRDGLGLVDAWVPYRLPAEVESGLLKLMRFFGLNYGAADFILTPDGRHLFLELNPVGEFCWLDNLSRFPITDAIADLLMGHGRAV